MCSLEPEAVTKVYSTFNPIYNTLQANYFILIPYRGATVND